MIGVYTCVRACVCVCVRACVQSVHHVCNTVYICVHSLSKQVSHIFDHVLMATMNESNSLLFTVAQCSPMLSGPLLLKPK